MPAHVCNKVTGEAAASSASDIFVASNIWIPELWGKTERRLHLQYLGQENEIWNIQQTSISLSFCFVEVFPYLLSTLASGSHIWRMYVYHVRTGK